MRFCSEGGLWAVRVACVGVKRLSGMVLSNEVLGQPLDLETWKKEG